MRSSRSAGRGSERVGWRWTSACGSLADAALHIAGVCAAQRAGGIFKLLLCTGIFLSALRLSRYVPASTCTRRKAVLARCAGPLAVQLAAPGARTRRRGGASACGAHCGGAVSLCGWPDSRSLQCCIRLLPRRCFLFHSARRCLCRSPRCVAAPSACQHERLPCWSCQHAACA